MSVDNYFDRPNNRSTVLGSPPLLTSGLVGCSDNPLHTHTHTYHPPPHTPCSKAVCGEESLMRLVPYQPLALRSAGRAQGDGWKQRGPVRASPRSRTCHSPLLTTALVVGPLGHPYSPPPPTPLPKPRPHRIEVYSEWVLPFSALDQSRQNPPTLSCGWCQWTRPDWADKAVSTNRVMSLSSQLKGLFTHLA